MIYNRIMLITDGTSFSSAHAYKVEGGRSLLRCGTHVKKEMGVPSVIND